jgi:hypothetical protein
VWRDVVPPSRAGARLYHTAAPTQRALIGSPLIGAAGHSVKRHAEHVSTYQPLAVMDDRRPGCRGVRRGLRTMQQGRTVACHTGVTSPNVGRYHGRRIRRRDPGVESGTSDLGLVAFVGPERVGVADTVRIMADRVLGRLLDVRLRLSRDRPADASAQFISRLIGDHLEDGVPAHPPVPRRSAAVVQRPICHRAATAARGAQSAQSRGQTGRPRQPLLRPRR